MKDISFARQEDITSIPPKAVLWEMSPMNHELEILRGRLAERIAELGTSARKVSLAINANVTYVAQIMNGKGGMPSASKLQAIARELETTTDWLLGKVDDSRQPISEVSFRDVPSEWRGSDSNGIPLLGTGFCDDLAVHTDDGEYQVERVQIEMDHTVRLIRRPPALWAAREAYAIYFHGSSMEPRFFANEIGIVDPRRPPGPGDFVVVQLSNGESDHVMTVLVKQLVRQNAQFVELAQYNPPRTFRLPRRMVARMHRIYSPTELLD